MVTFGEVAISFGVDGDGMELNVGFHCVWFYDYKLRVMALEKIYNKDGKNQFVLSIHS